MTGRILTVSLLLTSNSSSTSSCDHPVKSAHSLPLSHPQGKSSTPLGQEHQALHTGPTLLLTLRLSPPTPHSDVLCSHLQSPLSGPCLLMPLGPCACFPLPICLWTSCSSKLRHISLKPLTPPGNPKHSAHSPATFCTCFHQGNYLAVL